MDTSAEHLLRSGILGRMERDEILRVLRAFEAAGLDLFIKATADNIERLRAAFRVAYDNDPSIEEISTDDLLGDYPAVRYYPPTDATEDALALARRFEIKEEN